MATASWKPWRQLLQWGKNGWGKSGGSQLGFMLIMGMNVMSDLMSLYCVLTIVSKANGFAQLEKRSSAWQGEALSLTVKSAECMQDLCIVIDVCGVPA